MSRVIDIVSAVSPNQIDQIRALFLEYGESLGFSLRFQGFDKELAELPGMLLVAGRYEGMDERIVTAMDAEEVSLGDYVLSGGELAAAVVIDAVIRLLPGVLGHEDSSAEDSFSTGLLDCPHYTRPEAIDGLEVPKVLLSGDHDAVRRWRLKQALGRTWLRRPDLFRGRRFTAEEKELLDEFRAEILPE